MLNFNRHIYIFLVTWLIYLLNGDILNSQVTKKITKKNYQSFQLNELVKSAVLSDSIPPPVMLNEPRYTGSDSNVVYLDKLTNINWQLYDFAWINIYAIGHDTISVIDTTDISATFKLLPENSTCYCSEIFLFTIVDTSLVNSPKSNIVCSTQDSTIPSFHDTTVIGINSEGWINTDSTIIEFTASDSAGVDSLMLYHRTTGDTGWMLIDAIGLRKAENGLPGQTKTDTLKFMHSYSNGFHEFYIGSKDAAYTPESHGPYSLGNGAVWEIDGNNDIPIPTNQPMLMVNIDTQLPGSNINEKALTEYITETQFQVYYSANDTIKNSIESGLDSISLFYNYKFHPDSNYVFKNYLYQEQHPFEGETSAIDSSFSFHASQGNGVYEFYTKANDIAGNIQKDTVLVYTIVDTTEPVINTVLAYTDCASDVIIHDGWHNVSNEPCFKWDNPNNISGNNFFVAIRLDSNHVISPFDGESYDEVQQDTFYQVILKEGIWWFHVLPVSKAGIIGPQKKREFHFDMTAPRVTINIDSIRHGSDASIFFNFSLIDTLLHSNEVSGSAGLWYTSIPPDTSKIDSIKVTQHDNIDSVSVDNTGWYQLQLTGKDSAGNKADTAYTNWEYVWVKGVPIPQVKSLQQYVSDSLKVSWNHVVVPTTPPLFADSYRFQLDSVPEFTSPVYDTTINDTSIIALLEKFDKNSDVYLRIGAYLLGDSSNWSDTLHTFRDKESPNVSLRISPKPDTLGWIMNDTLQVVGQIIDNLSGSVDSTCLKIFKNDSSWLYCKNDLIQVQDTVNVPWNILFHDSLSRPPNWNGRGCGVYDSLTISAHDTVCNWGESDIYNFKVDTHLPVIDVTRNPFDSIIWIRPNADTSFSLNISVADSLCPITKFNSGIDKIVINVWIDKTDTLLNKTIYPGDTLNYRVIVPLISSFTGLVFSKIIVSDFAANTNTWNDTVRVDNFQVKVLSPVSTCFGDSTIVPIRWEPYKKRQVEISFSNNGSSWHEIVKDSLMKYDWDINQWLSIHNWPKDSVHTNKGQIKVVVQLTPFQSDSDTSQIFTIDKYPPSIRFDFSESSVSADLDTVCLLDTLQFVWEGQDSLGFTDNDSIEYHAKIILDSSVVEETTCTGCNSMKWQPEEKGLYQFIVYGYDLCKLDGITITENSSSDTVLFYVRGNPEIADSYILSDISSPTVDSICPGFTNVRSVIVPFAVGNNSEISSSVSVHWSRTIDDSSWIGTIKNMEYQPGQRDTVIDTIPSATPDKYYAQLILSNDCSSDDSLLTITLDTLVVLTQIQLPYSTSFDTIEITLNYDLHDTNKIDLVEIIEHNLTSVIEFAPIFIGELCEKRIIPFKYPLQTAKIPELEKPQKLELTFRIKDFAGNWSDSMYAKLIYDPFPPQIDRIIPPLDSLFVHGSIDTITLVFSEKVIPKPGKEWHEVFIIEDIYNQDIREYQPIKSLHEIGFADTIDLIFKEGINRPHGYQYVLKSEFQDHSGNLGMGDSSKFWIYFSLAGSDTVSRKLDSDSIGVIFPSAGLSADLIAIPTKPNRVIDSRIRPQPEPCSSNDVYGTELVPNSSWNISYFVDRDDSINPIPLEQNNLIGLVEYSIEFPISQANVSQYRMGLLPFGESRCIMLPQSSPSESNGIISIIGHYSGLASGICAFYIMDKPDKFYNAPNPFNPAADQQTEIVFEITEIDVDRWLNKQIMIRDAFGNEVIRLDTGLLQAGLNSVYWNGKNKNGSTVGNGVYMAVLPDGKMRLIAVVKR